MKGARRFAAVLLTEAALLPGFAGTDGTVLKTAGKTYSGR